MLGKKHNKIPINQKKYIQITYLKMNVKHLVVDIKTLNVTTDKKKTKKKRERNQIWGTLWCIFSNDRKLSIIRYFSFAVRRIYVAYREQGKQSSR